MTKTRNISDLGAFTPSGAGGVQRTVENKLRDVVSVKDFGAVGDGVANDTAAIQAAVTAASGKQLFFPDGNYSNSALPTGINDVHCTGTPRVNFTGTPIPLATGVYTGNKEIAIAAGVIRYYDQSTTNLGNGYVNGETVQIVQSANVTGTATVTTAGGHNGVATVTLVSGGSGYTAGNALLRSATGSGCQVTLTVSGGVIATVVKKSGWYFLKDGGQEHDPVFLGPVTTSGSASLVLNSKFADLGFDANEWTPSGFVIGPDETLANTGATFGGSVGTDSITINGTYNIPVTGFVSYNGTSWTVSGIGYTATWTSGATAYLQLDRPAGVKAAANFSTVISVMMRRQTADYGANYVDVGIDSITSTYVRLRFTDANGNNILSPTTSMKFWITDPVIQNQTFNFDANPGSTANIWMVGVFTRKPSLY